MKNVDEELIEYFSDKGYPIKVVNHPCRGGSRETWAVVLDELGKYNTLDEVTKDTVLNSVVRNKYYQSNAWFSIDNAARRMHEEAKQLIAKNEELALGGDYDQIEFEVEFSIKIKNVGVGSNAD